MGKRLNNIRERAKLICSQLHKPNPAGGSDGSLLTSISKAVQPSPSLPRTFSLDPTCFESFSQRDYSSSLSSPLNSAVCMELLQNMMPKSEPGSENQSRGQSRRIDLLVLHWILLAKRWPFLHQCQIADLSTSSAVIPSSPVQYNSLASDLSVQFVEWIIPAHMNHFTFTFASRL